MENSEKLYNYLKQKDTNILLELKKQYEWEQECVEQSHIDKLGVILYILQERGELKNIINLEPTDYIDELKDEIRNLQRQVNILRNQKICKLDCREQMKKLTKGIN